jgi:hypothetical protein
MPLIYSDLIQRIARSIYHAIREEVEALGYIPNKTDYSDDDAGVLAYNNAVKAIKAIKKYAIEVFGHGSSESRYEKTVPRIVITLRKHLPGNIGGDYAPFFEAVGGDPLAPDSYIQKKQPPLTSSLEFEIFMVTESATQDYLMTQILAAVLPKMGYIKFYDEPTDAFFIEQTGFYENPAPQQGVREKVYLYSVPDVFEIPDQIEESDIGVIKSIEVDTKIQKKQTLLDSDTDSSIQINVE